MIRFAALAAALALGVPARVAAAPAPAPASRPPITIDRDTPAPGWDDEPIAPPPATAPAPATSIPPATVAPPPPRPPNETLRRVGNGLWIGAGVTAGVATLLNGFRASIASGSCQTENQHGGCELAWNLITPWTWGLNIASIAMAGSGGGMRGRYYATANPELHGSRRPAFVALGATLLAVGVITNATVRMIWLMDYASPEGREVFDFAIPGHAFAYYGTLQLTSFATAVGLAALVHATARAPRTARRSRMLVMPSGAGLQLMGRF